MFVTASLVSFTNTQSMERAVDEAEYVLAVLRRTRAEVSANPELFDPDAEEQIDKAIVNIKNVLQSARSELIMIAAAQEIKAA